MGRLMDNIKHIAETFMKLHIPFDKKFFNLPLPHYELMVEQIGYEKVQRHIRDVLMYYKNDKIVSEKARILSRKLKKKFLIEGVGEESEEECECGFLILEDMEVCPVCGKELYKGRECFYKNLEDSSCSLDGQDCSWKSRKDCGKEV
jgi:hypothetical protein